MKIKKNYIIALLLITLLGIAIYASFQERYNQLILIVKHTSFFLFFALFTVIIIKYFYKRIKLIENIRDNVKWEILLKLFTVIVFALALFTISKIQLDFIDKFETPHLVYCEYHDKNGNMLYSSYLPMSCPIFDVVEKTETSFVLHGVESVSGHNTLYHVNDNRVIDGEIEGNIIVDIEVEYDQYGRIKYYELLWTQFATIIKDSSQYNGYISINREVVNTYTKEEFISTQNNYQYKDLYEGTLDTTYDGHYNFEDELPVQTVLQASYTYGESSVSVGLVSYYTNQSEEPISSNIGSGSITILNGGLSVRSEFESSYLYSDDVYINTYYLEDMIQQLVSQPTDGYRVINIYDKNNSKFILKNTKYTFGLYHRNYDFNIYKNPTDDEIHIEDVFTLRKIVNTQYGFRYELYDDNCSSYENLYESNTRYLMISPSLEFHTFDYLDYIDILYKTDINNNFIYEFNPIILHYQEY